MKNSIILTILLIVVVTIAWLAYQTPSEPLKPLEQNPPNTTVLPNIINPINSDDVYNDIKSGAITRCIVHDTNHYTEYYINDDKIKLRSWYPNNKEIDSSFTLKISNNLYLWSGKKSSGTILNIPTPEEIKSNPEAAKLNKYIPTLETFEKSGIVELSKIGYQVECEIVTNERDYFVIPDIDFSPYDSAKGVI